MAPSTFTAPTWVNNRVMGHRSDLLFSRMKYDRVGFSVIRDASGAYTQVVDADDDVIRLSTAFYMGGRSYVLSAQEITDLTAAGFGQYIVVS